MIDKKKFGAKIKTKRKEIRLTQREVSQLTGLSRNYISDLESGRYLPSVETLVSLAEPLKLDLNALLMTEIQVYECDNLEGHLNNQEATR
ncbi:helix-turn-helix domain-containing protein [Paenibacillus larvae]|uniref:Putative phage protein n=1 Tax=Paenibacillus larvae subsp. larvae TaxID=147375 RepID=A0A6C0QV22_9BACL|nr:helix-turn-helix transcriptional regulator [Paenibacillus larvae]QHZ52470.1 putative phage protein [Paenibacillus larvae subsp. larvae]